MEHRCRKNGRRVGALDGPGWASPGEIVKLVDSPSLNDVRRRADRREIGPFRRELDDHSTTAANSVASRHSPQVRTGPQASRVALRRRAQRDKLSYISSIKLEGRP